MGRRIVLASASPQRKKLLAQAGVNFEIQPSKYEEEMNKKLPPRALARYLSRKKAEDVADRSRSSSIVIGIDTFVVSDGVVFGKPKHAKDAAAMLFKFSGKRVLVISGFTIIDTSSHKSISRSVVSSVYFKKLSKHAVAAYIATGDPLDKSGSFSVQGKGKDLIQKIDGPIDNIIGLPVNAVLKALLVFGI